MQHNVLVENYDKARGDWTEFLKFNTTEEGVRFALRHASNKSIMDFRMTMIATTDPDSEDYDDNELEEFFAANW